MIQRYIQHSEFEKQRPQHQLEPIHTDIDVVPSDVSVHPKKKRKLQKIVQDMSVLKKEVKVVDKKGKDITEEVVKTEIPKKLPKQKPAVQPTPNTPEEVVKKIKKEATEKTKGLNLDKIVRYGAILVGVYFLLKPQKSVEKTTTTVKKVKV